MHLFHYSDNPAIPIFEPRIMNGGTEAKVWAIDDYHSPHYLFPRDCPRVCIWPSDATSTQDLHYYFGLSGTQRMIAIETAWYDRVRSGRIYRYRLDPTDFHLYDSNAGYYTSQRSIKPIEIDCIDDLVGNIVGQGIELRITTSLKSLHQQVPKSTLNYSMIRMRNAVLE